MTRYRGIFFGMINLAFSMVLYGWLLTGRRGQILGFDTREGWDGWDVVRAKMPEAEIGDLIIEVRSATAGAGSFTFKFDHMAELTGKTADQIVAARRAAE